ncbi:regulatory signaling modulator protein AmpE [Legionella jamestowniensis]|uniref:Inner membrane protein AmpE n=1 Tax=Legionella jamestowniensis TaxID=455 RepID=A0A0W0UU51_9GAMM|nr:regulatory signaling modulator protein AmpE [Legionella jamestowniensis]KTD11387.1 inner membrane protein AmpE [Legionella jamestowniensis]SFL68097.1 AmpE protein [Legionella jamestowniensis DSM 19215]
MKLFVIVLCLLSERYLVHTVSHNRFYWFSSYFIGISEKLRTTDTSLFSQALILLAVVLPPIVLLWIIFYIFGPIVFGLVGLLLNLVIFYYCLGPENPFYPVRAEDETQDNEGLVGNYFAKVNGQLFAVIFWYIVTGPLGIVFYRLVSLCRAHQSTTQLAQDITDVMDWIPARLTALLYLLVGNFQKGIHFFMQMFFSVPEKNDILLSNGGLLAARTNENDPVPIPYAESLVEHALVVYLVFLALFTLVSWL